MCSSDLDKNTLVIAITQSGETADTLAAMESAREAGCPQAVVLEAEGTQATRVANFTLPVKVGQEIGVASTKTLVGSMTVLLQLAIVLAKARGEISREEEAGYVQNLARRCQTFSEKYCTKNKINNRTASN